MIRLEINLEQARKLRSLNLELYSSFTHPAGYISDLCSDYMRVETTYSVTSTVRLELKSFKRQRGDETIHTYFLLILNEDEI
jgi:hypothetical protein